MQPEYLEEELERLSEPPERGLLSRDSFMRPISALLSKPALTVDVDELVGQAIAKMRAAEFGAVLVTRGGKLVGMLTERVLICNVIGVVDRYEERTAGELMRPDPISLRPDEPILYALHNMHVGGYRHVPIVDHEGRPVSVVSLKDVVRFILGHFSADVYNITREPFRGEISREGA